MFWLQTSWQLGPSHAVAISRRHPQKGQGDQEEGRRPGTHIIDMMVTGVVPAGRISADGGRVGDNVGRDRCDSGI